MVGGGGLFFTIDAAKKRWINDIDSGLMAVYMALRDRPDDFIRKCRQISPQIAGEALVAAKNGRALYNARLKQYFTAFSDDTTMDQALRWFFIHRTVWGGRVNYDLKSRMYFSNPSGWNIVLTDKLEKTANILQNTDISCTDYEQVMLSAGDDVLIYVDPPYYCNTEQSTGSRLYRHNFEVEDHERLCKVIKECRHKVILSYDNHPKILSLYNGFNINYESWKYCGRSSAPDQLCKTKVNGSELIIRNF